MGAPSDGDHLFQLMATTGGNGIRDTRWRSFRDYHQIAVHRLGEWAERGEITLDAAAKIIGVIPMTALRMIKRGDLKGRQLCHGAPWVIKAEDMVAFADARPDRPLTANPAQKSFEFSIA